MQTSQPIQLEVASAAEIAFGGRGWVNTAGFAVSPFGTCLIGECPRGICHLSFVDTVDGVAELEALHAEWPHAQWRRDDGRAAQIAEQIFAPLAHCGAFPLFVHGTPFQVQVWRALLQVPHGALVSYGQLAAAIGRPSAARAVGSAVGQNRISILIPCHRVILGDGTTGNYHWGADRKRALIAWEREQQIAGA